MKCKETKKSKKSDKIEKKVIKKTIAHLKMDIKEQKHGIAKDKKSIKQLKKLD